MTRRLLVCLLLSVALTPASAAAPPPQWLPQESWPGGRQYDARLDAPVRFWRAGLTLAEVFASAEEQTGVRLAFWPADDSNRRVRVNLYLNRERPPSLRDLMVQMSWVMDCTFGTTTDAQTGERSYLLLSTTLGQGAEEEARQEVERERQYWEGWRKRNRPECLARMQVYAEALKLSRAELIARYRGKDDYLLYQLLEPKQRAAVALVLSLPAEEQRALVQEEMQFERDARELSPAQQELLRQLVEGGDEWLHSGALRVHIWCDGIMSMSGVSFSLGDRGEEDQPQGRMFQDGPGWGWISEGAMDPKKEIALRRLLGESITAEQEQEYVESRRQEADFQRASDEASEKAREETREEARRAEHRRLSREGAHLLASTVLPLPEAIGLPRYLWEIQQATAEATGLNIVSDSFCDLPRTDVYSVNHAPETALDVLSFACLTRVPRSDLMDAANDGVVGAALGWEWGDAGSFLRFRSLLRDLWRGVVLPEEAVSRLDRWLAPQLTPEALAQADDSITVPVDLDDVLWFAGHLGWLQGLFGGYLTYADPADAKEQWASPLRGNLLLNIARKPTSKLLSTLTPAQWELLRGEGLSFATDLDTDQKAFVDEHLGELSTLLGVLEGDSKQYVMRLVPGEAPLDTRTTYPNSHHLGFFRGDKEVGGAPLMDRMYGGVRGWRQRRRAASSDQPVAEPAAERK
jgi:hypothetical protein